LGFEGVNLKMCILHYSGGHMIMWCFSSQWDYFTPEATCIWEILNIAFNDLVCMGFLDFTALVLQLDRSLKQRELVFREKCWYHAVYIYLHLAEDCRCMCLACCISLASDPSHTNTNHWMLYILYMYSDKHSAFGIY
jgi:hypothetical protein